MRNGISIELVEASPEHAPLYCRWRDQPSTVRHNPNRAESLEQCRERFRIQSGALTQIWTTPRLIWFARAEGEWVANVSVKNAVQASLVAEIGYGVAEEHQGKGIGTSAARALIDKLFNETELRKIIAYVHDRNIPSARLLTRLGFTQEGFLREHSLIGGKPENQLLFGLLRREWRP